jgi:hypothetical protein
MYKNTKSTNRISVLRKNHSNESYLEKLYGQSKTIFVDRGIVSPNLFGDLPTSSPVNLIKSNKKYLSEIGYLETQIDQMPDWFLFHPRISVLIRCLRDIARTDKRSSSPFELELIARGEPPNNKKTFNITNNHHISKDLVNYKNNSIVRGVKTQFELAFEKAKTSKSS